MNSEQAVNCAQYLPQVESVDTVEAVWTHSTSIIQWVNMTCTVFTNVPSEAYAIFMIRNQILYPFIIFSQMVVYVFPANTPAKKKNTDLGDHYFPPNSLFNRRAAYASSTLKWNCSFLDVVIQSAAAVDTLHTLHCGISLLFRFSTGLYVHMMHINHTVAVQVSLSWCQ